MSDGHELVTQEHGALVAISTALGGLITAIAQKVAGKGRGPSESKEQREKRLELERQLHEAEEKVLEARFQAVESKLTALINAQAARVDSLQHENGSQGERLKTAEKDINNLWRRERGEEPK